MFNLLKKLFMLFLPAIRVAAIQTAADEIAKLAYPDTRTKTRGGSYYRYRRPKTADDQTANERRRVEAIKKDIPSYGTPNWHREQMGMTPAKERFHDVLMMAIDISGPNAEVVKQFLIEAMPERTYYANGVSVDSCWIADDKVSTSDCDSAVFVHKGEQEDAREYLRDGGYSS